MSSTSMFRTWPVIALLMLGMPHALAAQTTACEDSAAAIDWRRFYPMEVGNEWQYEELQVVNMAYQTTGYTEQRIVGDTTVAGQPYFITKISNYSPERVLQGIRTVYVRYDSSGTMLSTYDLTEPIVEDLYIAVNLRDIPVESWDGYVDCREVFGKLFIAKHYFYTMISDWGATYLADLGLLNWGGGGNHGNLIVSRNLLYAYVSGESYGQITVGVEQEPLRQGLYLAAVYPNPSSGAVRIPFRLAQAGHVRLAAYDVLGREVAVILDGVQSAGDHEVQWSTTGLSAGVYFMRIQDDGAVQMRSLTLFR